MPHLEFSDRPGSEVEAGAGIGGTLPARPGFACCGTAQSLWRSPYMSLRADSYRQRAAEAKGRAAQARVRSAFENVATKKIIARYANRHTQGTFWEYGRTITGTAFCVGG
jgi:hypothetical protein